MIAKYRSRKERSEKRTKGIESLNKRQAGAGIFIIPQQYYVKIGPYL